MASVPYEFDCDKDSGFLPDPDEHKSVGYITSLAVSNAAGPFKPDLQVFVQWNGTGTQPSYPGLKFSQSPSTSLLGKAAVVGVIDKFSWPGGPGNPITIDFWVSQENANQLKAIQQGTLTTAKVTALQWWICAFDQETKVWYERSYPLEPDTITGIIAGKENPELNVDLTGAPVKDEIDVSVYKVSMSVQPPANQQYSLHFASSSAKPVAKSWGLVVGTLAQATLLADPS
jgi:hypothetical protein